MHVKLNDHGSPEKKKGWEIAAEPHTDFNNCEEMEKIMLDIYQKFSSFSVTHLETPFLFFSFVLKKP